METNAGRDPPLPAAPTYPDPEAPAAGRAGRRRFRRRLALGAALALGSCAGGVAGCAVWPLHGKIDGDAGATAVGEALGRAGLLPVGDLASDARAGGVGEALDEALRRGDAEPLAEHPRRVPGTRVCFAWEYDSLSGPPWQAYWRTYGLPDLAVPDGHWAIVALRAGTAPEFAVVLGYRLILTGTLGRVDCIDAERLRLYLENRPGRPSLLRMSAEP